MSKQYRTNKDGDYVLTENGIDSVIPNDEKNRHYLKMLSEVDEGVAEIIEYSEPEESLEELRYQRMMTGVDFNGVMCSAFKEDQWGLASVKDFILAGQDVQFQFENGSVLELTSDNLSAFEMVWVPFRQTCLKVNFTG